MENQCSTKELARKLGLLKRRSSTLPNLKSNKNGSSCMKSKKTDQIFSYLIVLDFESTCWKDKHNSYRPEVIEFPAVLLNLSNGEVEDKFHQYVQPTEHPKLSQFCKDLTGISQEKVNIGVPIGTCLNLFNEWIQKSISEKNITFPSTCKDQRSNCIFLTWSDWDLNVCLSYECKRKRLHCPSYLKSWIDLRSTYRLFYGRNPKGLNGALEDLGMNFVGKEHSGIDDALNTAKLAWRMMRDGCLMKATKSLILSVDIINNAENSSGTANQPSNAGVLKSPYTKKEAHHGYSAFKDGKARVNCLKESRVDMKTPSPGLQKYVTTYNSSSVTPPLCECGKRCKRKKVMNPGPNTGRIFYTCSIHGYEGENSKGCAFFKWESTVACDSSRAMAVNVNAKFTTPKSKTIVDISLKDRTRLKEHYVKLFTKQ